MFCIFQSVLKDLITVDITLTTKIVSPVDDALIESIMDDPFSFPILRELCWATIPLETLLGKYPGSESTINRLSDAGIVYSTPLVFRMTEAYQGFINELDHPDITPECFFIDLSNWHEQLGQFVSEAAYILVTSFFNSPVDSNTYTGVEQLLIRGGLMNKDGKLTTDGKDVAYRIFVSIAPIFDTISVDPDEFYRRWTQE